MRASGFLEAEHDGAQVRVAQPMRREPSQHAAFRRPRSPFVQRAALAGDDNDQFGAARLRMAQEAAQRLMRFGLVHAMQVDRIVDLAAPARELALQPPFDRREGRRGWLRRSACGSLSRRWRRGRGRLGDNKLRWRRQDRAAAPRDAARDFGPERDLLVAQAPQTMRARRRLLHRSSPSGSSTTNSPRWRMAPARAPAASPLPKNRSARAGPTIAEPVS